MSMPQIPEGKYRPTMEQTVVDLLESIALEEIAISHILNAQGENGQALVGKYQTSALAFSALIQGFSQSREMINSVIMKEWLLYNKLQTVLAIANPPAEELASELPAKHPISQCKNFVQRYGCTPAGTAPKTLCQRCVHQEACGR